MRNRIRRQKSGESISAIVSNDTSGSGDGPEQFVEEHETPEESQSYGDNDTDNLRQSLTRTTTREEITQTDDDLTFPLKDSGKRPWIQYRRIIFILGCVMGVALAWAFRSPDLQLEGLLDSMDMADFFDDLKAALPSALPMGIMREAKEIQEHSRQTAATGAFSIGEQMLQEGMSAHYPVVMVQSLCNSNL
jgi:hypothetical protein